MIEEKTNQKGSIRKKGNQYYYRFWIKNDDNQWVQKEFKGGSNYKETKYMLDKALNEYKEYGMIFDPGDITISQLIDEWYAADVEYSNRASTTIASYDNYINHIKRHPLGSTKLRNVTIEQLQSYIDLKTFGTFDENGERLEKAYAESTVKKHITILNSIFKFAIYPKQYIKMNLMDHVKMKKKSTFVDIFTFEDDKKAEVVDYSEYLEILDMLKNDERVSYLLLPVQIAYWTGMRAGEICGLCWQDIDFENRVIKLQRTMYYDRDNKCWELKLPKSNKKRVIEMSEPLVAILRDARKAQMEEQTRYGKYYQKHYVQVKEQKNRIIWQIFSDIYTENGVISSRNTKGRMIDEIDKTRDKLQVHFVCTKFGGELLTTQTLKYCNKVIQKKLPHIHFHLFRHTFATTLLTNGATEKDVQILLGHSDSKVTKEIYSHVTKKSQTNAINILEKASSI